ncbi:PEFG-CTERM sorting domain-containing protein [Candidatus Nitrosopumilus sp. SW]|nr:PEFG-CTERM sorting domain-containing protein [Candidatus Nitrosopumilus sp. SW]
MFFIVISLMTTSVFAEPSLEVNVSKDSIKALESVLISGKITDVTKYKPVTIKVIAPDGSIAYQPQVPIEDNGEFKKLLQPTIPSFKVGTYTVFVSHEDTEITARTSFNVLAQELPRNDVDIRVQESIIQEKQTSVSSVISMTADAENGSDIINVSGVTKRTETDITLIVNSPSGNIVAIDQVSPKAGGSFEVQIKTGGSMWKEDGVYTITANQGVASEYKKSVQVEIKDGVVVPEFGVIASLILGVSIISIIIFSAKSRLAIVPRY